VNGLQSLRRPEEVGRIRGKRVEDILFPAKQKAGEEAPEPAAEKAETKTKKKKKTETTSDGDAEDHADA
jgi:hypothetical protein